MGRPPCCEKIGLKKGPWTPEEDILLVSYIQEHGPGNWRAVPSNTGLLRCSKSCRLRWTNYLRPGIKRGNFTEQEESMIIHLQALLGNRWAAIASYLPERTDNDIKNYWNTHLRKKLKKLQTGQDDQSRIGASLDSQPISRGQWEKRLQTDMHMAKQALFNALSIDKSPNTASDSAETSNGYSSNTNLAPSAAYASSTENISRLLQGWMGNSQKDVMKTASDTTQWTATDSTSTGSPETLESFFRFESSVSTFDDNAAYAMETKPFDGERKASLNSQQVPLSMLEKWLFEEGVNQDQDMVGVSLDDIAFQLL